MMVAIVAVSKLSLTANRISDEKIAETKLLQLVKVSMETKMPTINTTKITRALIVAALKVRSPVVPFSILNTRS
jgi:hypothetical protein